MNSAIISACVSALICLPLGYVAGTHRDPGREPFPPDAGFRGAGEPGRNPSVTVEPSRWRVEDFRRRTAEVLAIPDRIERWQALLPVLGAMNRENAGAIVDGLQDRHNTGAATLEEGRLIQFRYGQVMGAGSMTGLPLRGGDFDGRFSVQMQGWASVDPAGAREWIESVPKYHYKKLMANWLEGMCLRDAATVTELYGQLDAGEQRDFAYKVMEQLDNQGGLEAVQYWMERKGSLGDQEEINRRLTEMTYWKAQHPEMQEQVAGFLTAQAASGSLRKSAFGQFALAVAPENPGKAFELLERMMRAAPQFQGESGEMIAGTVERLMPDHADKLGTWLNANRGHAYYDQVTASFAARIQGEDPESALRWAETIGDESLREQTRNALTGAAR